METGQWAAWLPVLFIGAWASAPAILARRRPPILGLLLMAGTFLLSCHHYNSCLHYRQAYMTVITEGETVILEGQLYRKEWKNNRLRLYLKNCCMCRQELEEENVYSCNRVLAYSDSDVFCIGDTLVIDGQIHMFDQAVNEGMFDLAAYYASMGIDFALYTSQRSGMNPGSVRTAGNNCEDGGIMIRSRPRFSMGELLYRLQQELTATVALYMQERETGILCSILYGDKTNLESEEKELFQAAGISHILAISGLHVSLLGMGLYQFLRRRGGSFIESGLVAGIMLILFATLTGGSLSTKRAVGMLLLTMLGQVFGRRTDMLNSLGMVLMVLLWETPFLISNSGFYFTLASLGGIAITGNLLSAAGGTAGRSFIQKSGDALRMSLAIQMTVIPVTAYYYSEIPLLSIFQNLLVLPLLTPLLLLSLAGSVCGIIALHMNSPLGNGFYTLGKVCFGIPNLILKLYHGISSFIVQLPFSSFICGKPTLLRCILFYIILGGCMLFLWIMRERERDAFGFQRGKLNMTGKEKTMDSMTRAQIFIGCLLLLLMPLLLFFRSNRELEIDLLDVGQGDAIYINATDGSSFFIDGGSTTVSEVGKYRILPFLKAKGEGRISYWFISHMDQDHMNGMAEILQSGYRIEHLVFAEAMPRDENYQKLCEMAAAQGTEVLFMKPQDVVKAGSTSICCLFPETDAGMRYEDANDLCLTLLLECQDRKGRTFRALFTGDLAEKGEKEVAGLLEKKEIDKVDFYKVGHHGSRYSSSEILLDAMRADIAVISCGEKNRYGHPSAEAVERLNESGCRVFYTMYGGEIMTRWRRHSISIKEYRGKEKAFSNRGNKYGH